MKAVVWNGKYNVQVEQVPDPVILNASDAILRVTSTAICGSDLHLYDGIVPGMMKGDILGHEFMGEIVEVGPEVKDVRIGDRVVVPFVIACGRCYYCQQGLTSLCDNTNLNAWMVEGLYGYSSAGFYGYTHLFGGYAGGQAEFVRVPFADTNCAKVPAGLTDEQVLFLTDVFPTGYMAAENGNIQPGDTVAIWGCGPVGQFAIKSAFMLGASQVFAIDRIAARLNLAAQSGAQMINYDGTDVIEALKQLTAGRGPDVCIDAVGLEAHGFTFDAIMDRALYLTKINRDMAHALRQIIQACRKGGTVSIPGVYAGFVNALPIGAAFGKGLQFRMGQTHVHRYIPLLLERIQQGVIDPSFIITHRLPLVEAPHAYEMFKNRKDNCIKVVLKP